MKKSSFFHYPLNLLFCLTYKATDDIYGKKRNT